MVAGFCPAAEAPRGNSGPAETAASPLLLPEVSPDRLARRARRVRFGGPQQRLERQRVQREAAVHCYNGAGPQIQASEANPTGARRIDSNRFDSEAEAAAELEADSTAHRTAGKRSETQRCKAKARRAQRNAPESDPDAEAMPKRIPKEAEAGFEANPHPKRVRSGPAYRRLS